MADGILDPWVQFFKTILDMPCPPNLSSSTESTIEIDRRNKEIFWKIKGITAKTTYRMFMKYGDSKVVNQKDKVALQFANYVMLNYSIPLLESHLPILLSRKSNFVGAKCLNYSIKFISQSIKRPNTMEKLKPYVENILLDTCIPIMYVTEKDVESFESDAVEFIRNQYDFCETLFQPKNQIQDLLVYLTKYKSDKKTKGSQPDYLSQFLGFAVKNLNEYNAKIANNEVIDWRIKEALMFAIGTIRESIWKVKEIKG